MTRLLLSLSLLVSCKPDAQEQLRREAYVDCLREQPEPECRATYYGDSDEQ